MDNSKISVEEAIKKGKQSVNMPLPFIMIGTIALGFFGMEISGWSVPLSILGSFILSWLYWSFAITKWRIWAFSNVDDIRLLELQAIIEKLIWKRGSIFEKTEIRTKKEKLLIDGFNKELEKMDTTNIFDEPNSEM
jgi:hypothetical protein